MSTLYHVIGYDDDGDAQNQFIVAETPQDAAFAMADKHGDLTEVSVAEIPSGCVHEANGVVPWSQVVVHEIGQVRELTKGVPT